MANDELARAYAQAIYEMALARWQKQLRAVNESLEAKQELLTRLDNPAGKLEAKKAEMNGLLPRDADGELKNFLYLLASRNQLGMLSHVLAELDRFAARGPSRELARVTSAVELTPDERTRLENKLHAQFGREIDFEYRVDPSLLGGVVVRVGDRVIDGSVSGKLAAMRQKLETTR